MRTFANVAQLVEQLIRNQQVSGSSPLIGSTRGVAQFGSAFGSGPKGRWFKSSHLDHTLSSEVPASEVFCFYMSILFSSMIMIFLSRCIAPQLSRKIPRQEIAHGSRYCFPLIRGNTISPGLLQHQGMKKAQRCWGRNDICRGKPVELIIEI